MNSEQTPQRTRSPTKARNLKIWAIWIGKAGFYVGKGGPKGMLDSRVVGNLRVGGVYDFDLAVARRERG